MVPVLSSGPPHRHTQTVADGNTADTATLSAAIKAAQGVTDKPSIIKVRTIIGYGAKLQGTGKVGPLQSVTHPHYDCYG